MGVQYTDGMAITSTMSQFEFKRLTTAPTYLLLFQNLGNLRQLAAYKLSIRNYFYAAADGCMAVNVLNRKKSKYFENNPV
jgi:hypothetical protein